MRTLLLPTVSTLFLLSLLLSSCQYEAFDKASDFDAVITMEHEEYDYSKNQTYAVVDEVTDLSDETDNPIEIEDLEQWEALILAQIHQNMQDLGYTEETGAIEDADVVLAAGVVATENWQFYGYYYWWGWDGYYYYYPGYVYAADMSSGSVVITMIDPNFTVPIDEDAVNPGQGEDADQAYDSIWSTGIISLLNNVSESKIRTQIDQAFSQSPYLDISGGTQ